MSVTAKFYCAEITETAWAPGARKVILQPVTRGEDNKSWAAATPSGRIELQIQNPLAAEQFVNRAEYLITFERADASE